MLSLHLYKILSKHNKLAEKRSPLYNQGKLARFFAYFFISIAAIYLLGFSIIFALEAQDLRTMTAYEFMYSLVPFFFTIDFYIRFAFQQTPTQQVKPYILLPIPRTSCIDFFIIRQLISGGNFIWMLLYVPYAIMSIVFCEGIATTLLFLSGLFIIELISCQTYSIIRSKINQHVGWWGLALFLLAMIFSPMLFSKGSSLDSYFAALFDTYASIGNWLCNGNIIAWFALLSLLAVLAFINRKIQYALVYNELSDNGKEFSASGKIVTSQAKHGLTRQFITLEYLSIKRNLNVRKQFLYTNLIVLIFSLLFSFTSIYDEFNGVYFWALYNFALYGTRMIIRTMSFEGNYIESLFIGSRSIEHLLRAKYYIYSIILIVPLIFMLPSVFVGKTSILTLLSFMIFTAGVDNFLFMQMIAYNKQTMPLNKKFTGKVAIESNWIIIVVELAVFFVPFILISIMTSIHLENVAFITLAVIGSLFIATHRLWIARLYERISSKKYEMMESLINTRQV